MRYLVIDASLSGTGIRDKYEGGYLAPEDLGLSSDTIQRLNAWLSKYENEHYNGFTDDNIIDELDREGKEIALLIKAELSEVKLEYFSDARMTNEII
ncbi:MAG: hypothetical protein V4615_02485 [Bacteroidota bacterium]